MHFFTLTLLTLTTPILATPYHGQYNLPQNKTIPVTLPETHVYPTSSPTNSTITAPSSPSSAGHGGYGYGSIHNHPLSNSTSTSTKTKSAHAVLPSGTGTGTAATAAPDFAPFTGASAPVKGASLALVIVAGVVVGWF